MDINEVPQELDPEPWYWSAACASSKLDPETWFPHESEYRGGSPNTDKAKSICKNSCTVRVECLGAVMKEEAGQKKRFGIRGGLDPKERRKLAKFLTNRALRKV